MRLRYLADPTISQNELIALRQIAQCLQEGTLTQDEARSAIERISPKFAECFIDAASAAAIVDAVEAILQARSPAAARLSRSHRFRLKAVECVQLANNAAQVQIQETYRNLAQCYEQLATRAEAIERHRYERILARASLRRQGKPSL